MSVFEAQCFHRQDARCFNRHCEAKLGQTVSVISLTDNCDSLAKELEAAVTSAVVEDLKMHVR